MTGGGRRSNQDSVAQISGKKLLPVLGAVGIAYFCFALYVAKDLGDPARANRARLTADAGVDRMSEEDREDYLLRSVRIDGFSVTPATKPDGETVPGLLTVAGTIANDGDRPLHAATLMVMTKDADGAVGSSFQEDLLKDAVLSPGQEKRFRFRIPRKPTYRDFEYRLR